MIRSIFRSPCLEPLPSLVSATALSKSKASKESILLLIFQYFKWHDTRDSLAGHCGHKIIFVTLFRLFAASSGALTWLHEPHLIPIPCCGHAIGDTMPVVSLCCHQDGLQPYSVGKFTLQPYSAFLSAVFPLSLFAPGWTLSMNSRPGSLLTLDCPLLPVCTDNSIQHLIV